MLPNTMTLAKSTEEQLKKLKGATGISPNVSSRIAFFRSVESGFKYSKEAAKNTDGTLSLSKIVWLGETQLVTELVLKQTYPGLDAKEYQQAWAAHVEDGIAALRNHKNLLNFTNNL